MGSWGLGWRGRGGGEYCCTFRAGSHRQTLFYANVLTHHRARNSDNDSLSPGAYLAETLKEGVDTVCTDNTTTTCELKRTHNFEREEGGGGGGRLRERERGIEGGGGACGREISMGRDGGGE